ncbi:MAG TPA: hypothetical protein VFC23_00565 [Thermoanaerobaculia bacterium]|nr:hypothetical protein [Thermoanaerobaculia bacterium]
MADTKGKVYVFNLHSETVDIFSTNGLSAGTITGWQSGGTAPYTPAQLAVGRVLNANESPAHFVNGKNKVIFSIASGLFTFEVTISGSEFPITQNLLLYVSVNVWTLYNQFGVQTGTGPVISGPVPGVTAENLR